MKTRKEWNCSHYIDIVILWTLIFPLASAGRVFSSRSIVVVVIFPVRRVDRAGQEVVQIAKLIAMHSRDGRSDSFRRLLRATPKNVTGERAGERKAEKVLENEKLPETAAVSLFAGYTAG